MITRIFHQIWLGPNSMPEEFEAYRASWVRLHPHWELRLWGEEDLPDDLVHREVYEVRRSPVERSDILRLELLYRYGGVYLDVDFECCRAIDGLLEGVDFFAALLRHDRVNNAIFGAAPGHPLLQQAIETLGYHEIGSSFDKTKSGSHFFSKLVMDAPGVQLFPSHLFYPATPEQREQAYAIHHIARTWKDESGWRKAALRAEERLDQVVAKLEKERRAHERTKLKLQRVEQRLAAATEKAEQRRRDVAPEPREVHEPRVARGPEPGHLSILFFLRSIHFDRMFENLLRTLLERGHQIHVALMTEKRGLGEGKTRLFAEFAERHAFSWEQLDRRGERWLPLAVSLRHGLDYLRYLEPVYAAAEPLRQRARGRAPRLVRLLAAVPPFRRPLAGALCGLEAALPVPASLTSVVHTWDPDVVLVAPLVGLGSAEVDYVRAAHRAGVPTALPVASWDNLSNKGLLHEIPTSVIVWNELQVEEAVRLHGVPPERVVAVGAHSFDHWFTWEEPSAREAFMGRLGLDPARPLLLYFGSSYFISGDETPFVREWLERVRSHPRLRDAAVILRPHPQNVVGWAELDVDEPGKTVVEPREGTAPVDVETKRDYFDALRHAAAAAGVNTSAFVEAAIAGLPAFTLADGRFATQDGTLHFAYLGGGDNALLSVARTWEEHLDQIADAVEAPEAHRARAERFVATFVRPRGLEVPAAALAADAVERTAAERIEPARRPLLALLVVPVLPLVALLGRLRHPHRTWLRARKAFKQHLKNRRREQKLAQKAAAKRAAPVVGPSRTAKDEARAAKEQARAEKERERARKTKKAKRRPARVVLQKRLHRWRKVARRRRKSAWRGAVALYNRRYRFTYRTTAARVPSRNELPALLNARGLHGRAAEIGVKTGKFSAYLLERWHGELLVSIDPWLSVAPEEYVDRSNVSQDEFEDYYGQTRERLAPFGTRSEIWRTTSVEAARNVPDASFDFVYIDARHDYASVLEDLEAWYPKVRPGGIIAGHDYADGHFPQGDFGVKSAVDEFFAAKGLRVHATRGPSAVEMFATWIVEVPAGRPAVAEPRERAAV